jgi:hypothetical protein
VNILKQIDALNKVVPGARRDYERLSEFVHPNAHGAVYYFTQPGADNIVQFGTPTDGRTQTMGLFLAGASLFSLIDSDLWRFKSSMLGLLGDALQRKIDDYEARKTAPDEPIL